jgi:hypothetical protein
MDSFLSSGLNVRDLPDLFARVVNFLTGDVEREHDLRTSALALPLLLNSMCGESAQRAADEEHSGSGSPMWNRAATRCQHDAPKGAVPKPIRWRFPRQCLSKRFIQIHDASPSFLRSAAIPRCR